MTAVYFYDQRTFYELFYEQKHLSWGSPWQFFSDIGTRTFLVKNKMKMAHRTAVICFTF